jgi:hypothetical protein
MSIIRIVERLDEPRCRFQRCVHLTVVLLAKKGGGKVGDVSGVLRRDRLAAERIRRGPIEFVRLSIWDAKARRS